MSFEDYRNYTAQEIAPKRSVAASELGTEDFDVTEFELFKIEGSANPAASAIKRAPKNAPDTPLVKN
jgi:hypothetical protein